MTSFLAPERPRLGNGRPTWLGRNVALPDLHFSPAQLEGCEEGSRQAPGFWQVDIVLVDHWVSVMLTKMMEVEQLLADWREDPEEALKKWFKVEPPIEGPAPAGPKVQETVGGATASAEELDL